MSIKNTRYIFTFIVVIVGLTAYHRWLFPGPFLSSDWGYVFSQTWMDHANISIWSNVIGFGNVYLLMWRLPFHLLFSAFAFSGFEQDVSEKFIIFLPIIFLCSISAYLLIKKVCDSHISGLIGSFIFAFNTYFLSINTQGHVLLPVSFAFGTFTLLSFISMLEQPRLSKSIVTGLLLFITGFYDLRSAYILVGVLSLYLFYYVYFDFKNITKRKYSFVLIGTLPFLLFGLLNVYWLLPILKVKALTSNTIVGRQIFGTEFYYLQSSLTTFFPFWTGKEPAWFTTQNVKWYFWIYPLFAFVGLLLNNKNKNIIFFGILGLLGIFLSKQGDIPFPNFYTWMYTHFPGFNAFREASKFDYLTSLSYAVLIGAFVKQFLAYSVKKKNLFYAKYIVIGLLIILPLWNTKPLITGEINTIFIRKPVPPEYMSVKDLLFNENEFYRTFWVNINANWVVFNAMQPILPASEIIRTDFMKIIPFDDSPKISEGKKLVTFLRDKTNSMLLGKSSVKYIVVSTIVNNGEEGLVLGEKKRYFINALGKNSFYKRIGDDASRIVLYENLTFRPHIYATEHKENLKKDIPYRKIDFKKISQSEYQIHLSNVRKPIFIQFTDSYHSDWKMKVGEFSWSDVLLINNHSAPDAIHEKSALNYNEFYIDPEKVCLQFECKKNSDKNYDINITIYFKPQAYLYLGTTISGLILFLSLSYLIFYEIKKIVITK